METVGIYLKKEREAKAISLSEVARLTKISKFYLDYIERDEFEKLPQGPYIKGYISSYSEQIGSDVDEALKLYDALIKKENLTETVLPDDWETEETSIAPENHLVEEWKRNEANPSTGKAFSILRTVLVGSMTLFSIGIFVLAGFGFYHLFLFEKNSPEVVQLKPSPERNADTTLSTVIKEKNPPEKVIAAQFDHPTQEMDGSQEKTSDLDDAQISLSSQEKQMDPPVSANLKVLKASVCSGIKDRLPAGIATVFPYSTQRIYVWNQIQAEQIPSEIHHIYYFNDIKISDVTLKVRSNFWRTWSYKTIPTGSLQGQWRVDITTADGTVLKQINFEVGTL